MAIKKKIKEAESRLKKIGNLLKKERAVLKKYEQKQAAVERYIKMMRKQQ